MQGEWFRFDEQMLIVEAPVLQPSRSNSPALHLRLPPDLRGEIERAAETEERSFPQMLRLLVKRGLGSSASKPTDKAA